MSGIACVIRAAEREVSGQRMVTIATNCAWTPVKRSIYVAARSFEDMVDIWFEETLSCLILWLCERLKDTAQKA